MAELVRARIGPVCEVAIAGVLIAIGGDLILVVDRPRLAGFALLLSGVRPVRESLGTVLR